MPEYRKHSNIIEKTNLPLFNNLDKEISVDEKQRKFFGNYYNAESSVDPAEYDVVRGFLLGKDFDESTVDNLTISLLEIAKQQNLDITDLLTQLDGVGDTLKLNTLLCILLNTSRNRTSILGFKQASSIGTIQRTILA